VLLILLGFCYACTPHHTWSRASTQAAAPSDQRALPLPQDSSASGGVRPDVGSKHLSPAIEPVHIAQQQAGAASASDAAAPAADAT
jgi:hypothetical protein